MDTSIVVISRPEQRISVEVAAHCSKSPGEIKAVANEGDQDATMALIAGDCRPISLVSIGESVRQDAAGRPIKRPRIDGLVPTSESIRTGSCRFLRALALATPTLPSGAVNWLIDVSLPPRAAPIIKRSDSVSYVD